MASARHRRHGRGAGGPVGTSGPKLYDRGVPHLHRHGRPRPLFSDGPLSGQSIIALAAGILVLIKPEVLSYVVGVYLILIGLLQAGILRF